MKLYLETKLMSFEEDSIEHEIILSVRDEEFFGYDVILENNKRLVKDEKSGFYEVREKETWNSFPIYEIINGEIIDFDYNKYSYFADTDRRMALAFKINELYNPPSEAKILRKTLKKILDNLGIVDEKFEKYNTKINELINKNPKN